MFAQIISILVSHFFKQPGQESALASIPMLAVRRAFGLIATGLVALMFFFGGFVTILVDLIVNSFGHNELVLSPVSAVGLALVVVSGAGIAFALRKVAWQAPVTNISVSHEASPLNEALAKLVLDFVEERRTSRLHPDADEFSEPVPERPRAESSSMYM